RVYDYGEYLGHVLGYAGRMSEDEVADYIKKGYLTSDRVGKSGIELSYESQLRGTPGPRQIEGDATTEEVREIDSEGAKPATNVIRSIDAARQKQGTNIPQDSVAGLKSGKAVAMVRDVRTGELLADVSLPTYNSTLFSFQVDDEEYAKLLNDP